MATRLRVLLVGVGRRAREVVIPALHCASAWVDLAGVCARSAREVELLGGRWRAITRLLGASTSPAWTPS